jgi:hypothetical protein
MPECLNSGQDRSIQMLTYLNFLFVNSTTKYAVALVLYMQCLMMPLNFFLFLVECVSRYSKLCLSSLDRVLARHNFVD